MKRTISAMVGKGSVTHNNRDFIAENVDASRTQNNITYCNEKIEDVYEKLFSEALQKYNEKQTRSDRKIENYYEKIRTGKQEKTFHEVILQIGDKDNMGAESENGELAKKVLDKYMQGFQKRNPNLCVFSAHLHMDEATPHLHIDFVPFTTGSKRGLETRVSLKKALEAQGFVGGSRSDTEWNQWVLSEKEMLAEVMQDFGIEWEQKNTHEKHKTVSEFKLEKLTEEYEAVNEKKAKAEDRIENVSKAEEYALSVAQKLNDDAEKELPEPPALMSAKKYKTEYVLPFVKKLIRTIKNLARRCFRAEHDAKLATSELRQVAKERDELKAQNWKMTKEKLKNDSRASDFDKIKSLLGPEKIKELLKAASTQRRHIDRTK